LVVVMACQDGSSTLTAVADGVIADELCLTQFRSGRVEVIALNGGHVAPGIDVGDEAGQLSWGRVSPDASYVVGTSGTNLIAVTISGDRLWELKGVSVSGMPAISTDAQQIAFTSQNQQLTVYNVSTRELNSLGVNGRNPSWAPHGDRLAYDDGKQVHVYDLARSTAFEMGQGTEPSWTPDGNDVAVRVRPRRVDLVNAQTRERRAFIEASRDISVPRWSPNGEWMTYMRQGPRHWWSKAQWTGSEPNQILVRHVKSGTEGSIGEFYKANSGDYTWVTNRDLCRRASSAP
jgi:Tol biopolymer transport system component